jgi:hypothetical protein
MVLRYVYFDAANYFLKNAGADQMLSWKEIQRAPIKIVDKDNKSIGTLKFSLEDFDDAQDDGSDFCMDLSTDRLRRLLCDSDPKNLTYSEFKNFLSTMDDYLRKNEMILKTHAPNIKPKDCRIDQLKPEEARRVRDEQNERFAVYIQNEWAAAEKQINESLRKGKLSDVTYDILGFLQDMYYALGHGAKSPQRESICVTSRPMIVGADEIVSKEALQNKVIREFWNKVGLILNNVLDRAEKKRIKDLDEIWPNDIESNLVPDEVYVREDGAKKLGSKEITIWGLLSRVNPKLMKRIENWRGR